MTRIRVTFALLLAAAVVAGCGPADAPLSREQARGIARAISLTTADLPGYQRFAPRLTPADRRALDRKLACAGMTSRREAVAGTDAYFGARGAGLSSSVWVMRSSAIAPHDVTDLAQPRALRCFEPDGARAIRPVQARSRFSSHSLR